MMATGLGRLTVDWIMRTAAFEQGMDKVARKSKSTTTQIAKDAQQASDLVKASFSSLTKVAAGALGGLTAGAVVQSIIKNTDAMISEQTQLAAVLRSTGQAAGFNRDQLNEMAGALSGKSLFSTGEINKAQTVLLAFTGVIGNEFVRAQQAAADMSARTGMTISSAMETIGRSLDVPSKGLTALSRQGFRFTEEQAKMALYLENTGRTAEAQAIVLQALEESYGGAAKAARDTFGGAMQALQNTIGNLLTGGEGSLEGARVAVESLNEALSSPKAQAAFAELVNQILGGVELIVKAITAVPWQYTAQAVTVLATAITGRLLTSLFATTAAFVASTYQSYRYQAALASMAGVSTAAAVRITALSVAATAASRALALAGGPLGIFLLAGTAIYAAVSSSTKATKEYARALEGLEGPIEEVSKKLQDMTRDQRQAALVAAEAAIDANKQAVIKAARELENEIAGAMSGQFMGTSSQFDGFITEIQQAIEKGQDLTDIMKEAEKAGFISNHAIGSVITFSGELQKKRQELEESEVRAKSLADAIEGIGNSARSAAGGVSTLTEEMAKALEGGADYAKKLADRLVTAGLKTEAAKFDAMVKAGQLAFETEERANEVRKLALEYDAKIAASTKTRSTATNKQATEIQRVLDKLLPLEKITKDYDKELAILNKTQASGKITNDQYATALENLNKQREEAVRNLIPEEVKRMRDLERATEASTQAIIRQQELKLNTRNMSSADRELATAYSGIEENYRRQYDQMAWSPAGISEEQLTKLREHKEKELAIVKEYHDKNTDLNNSWVDGFENGMQKYVDSVGTMSEQVSDLVANALGHTEDALVNLITTGEFNIGALMQSIGQDVVRMLVRMGMQMAVNFAMSKLFASASAATAAITGSSMALAYAPAAAMASLASFGENSIPATAGIISTVGIAETMAFAGMFDKGGTIPAGSFGIVGEIGPEIVHGPANVTGRAETANLLNGARKGGTIVQVIQNRERAGEQEVYDDGENEIVRVFVADIENNGPISRTLNGTYGLGRSGR